MTLVNDKGEPIRSITDIPNPDNMQEEAPPSDGTSPEAPEEEDEEPIDPNVLMQKVPRMFQVTIRGITGQTDVDKLTKWIIRNFNMSIEMHDHIVPNGITIAMENDESVMRRIVAANQGTLKI